MWGWEQLYFNIKDGYLGKYSHCNHSQCMGVTCRHLENCHAHAEAILRGHRSGLLTVPDYNNLTQCEALDDIKLNLVRQAAWSTAQWQAQSCWLFCMAQK
jgi:hypothetical protein